MDDLVCNAYKMNIKLYINGISGLRYSDDGDSNDEKRIKESVKWLVENDTNCTYTNVEEYMKYIENQRNNKQIR